MDDISKADAFDIRCCYMCTKWILV